ncbi:MAG: phosphoribosylformylglycinamidine synthase subunit PurQ [Acidimicrobiia bacterium]|nr:phosphoribosylformylglycinamidine synthase subunit PurQ [Acidimicrobiia bacterium]
MTTRIGVVVFPGTNCELDVQRAVEFVGGQAELIWHSEDRISGFDGLILPGGFAHGDYLRTGALAGHSPVMSAVRSFAADGGPVVGICNGFQILCEAGLLPGALQKNAGLAFLCEQTELEVAAVNNPLTLRLNVGDVVRIPINHFEGNFVCDDTTLRTLEQDDRIVVRYRQNPNGSIADIAGICNAERNVVGLMPHPERALEAILGSADGKEMIQSILDFAA